MHTRRLRYGQGGAFGPLRRCPGDRVLDVGTGSGLVAIVAWQRGARVAGADPTPELHIDCLTMTFECDSAVDYCRIFMDYGWKSRIAALHPEEQDRFYEAVATATRPYRCRRMPTACGDIAVRLRTEVTY